MVKQKEQPHEMERGRKEKPVLEREQDRWIVTSQRAEKVKPWDAKALDEKHYVRKTKEGVRNAKSRIDMGQPKTLDRWKGKNFNTLARKTSEKREAAQGEKRRAIAVARVESYSASNEIRKDDFNVQAHPALIQRRTRDPSWGEVRQWMPPKGTVGLTRKEAMDSQMWSIRPDWVSSVP